jgi:hypothetical protein
LWLGNHPDAAYVLALLPAEDRAAALREIAIWRPTLGAN